MPKSHTLQSIRKSLRPKQLQAVGEKSLKKPEITPKQLRFCQEYVIDSNGTQAAIRAGYSIKTAQEQSARLLSKAIIKVKTAQLAEERAKASEITAEYVLNGLRDLHAKCSDESNDKAYSPGAATKSLELLGKYLKLFTDKSEVSGNLGVSIQVVDRFDKGCADDEKEADS